MIGLSYTFIRIGIPYIHTLAWLNCISNLDEIPVHSLSTLLSHKWLLKMDVGSSSSCNRGASTRRRAFTPGDRRSLVFLVLALYTAVSSPLQASACIHMRMSGVTNLDHTRKVSNGRTRGETHLVPSRNRARKRTLALVNKPSLRLTTMNCEPLKRFRNS